MRPAGNSGVPTVTAEGGAQELAKWLCFAARVPAIHCSLALCSLFVALAHALLTSAVGGLVFLDPGPALNEWGHQLPWELADVRCVMSRDVAELLTLFKSHLSSRCSFCSLGKPL